MNNFERLTYLLNHAEHNENLAAHAFQMIQGSPKEERVHLVQLFFQTFCEIASTNDLKLPVLLTPNAIKVLNKSFASPMRNEMARLQRQNLETEEFYRQLWAFISEAPAFKGTKDRMSALYTCALYPCMPYCHLDLTNTPEIPNEECCRICDSEKVRSILQRVRFIIRTLNRRDYTQSAAFLLQELNNLENDKEKCVLLTGVLETCS